MAFPSDLEIEVAFNNDFNEKTSAQSGWTSILPFVSSFNGDLRGREYERDQTEAGTLSVVLDNSDSRFLPGSVQSPYYPNVKSDRRFRIRGKNMVHPNVARGGSREHNLLGFIEDFGGLDNYTAGAFAMDSVRIITASAEPNAGIGEGKEKVNDDLATTKWTINTQAGWITYKLAIGVRVTSYSLTVPEGNPNNNPDDWTLQGSNNGSSWTTIHTVTGNTWPIGDYEEQTFTVTSPSSYLYYKLDITGNVGATSNTQLAEFTIHYDDPTTDLLLPDPDLQWFVEVTAQASLTTSTWHETVGWYVPVEYGVRLSHSAYIWRISGTEPTGAKYKLHVTYYDADFNVVGTVDPRFEVAGLPSSTTPAQIGFSHTPLSNAKYAIASLAIFISTTTNSTALVYGVTGIQSELPANLAPDVSGFRDQQNWQIQGDGDGTYANVGSDPSTSYLEVTWGDNDVNLYTVIPHLIPGEQYTATVEAKILNSQPNIVFSGDEGESGATINTGTFTQYTCYFQATEPEQELRFILQGDPTAATVGLQLRKLRVELGDHLTLSLPSSATEPGYTTWIRPKDIFEGWVESWPAVAGNTEMTVTVVDRLKRINMIELDNTLRESLFTNEPDLVMPLADSMLDTPGRFSQLGAWSVEEGGPTYVDITATKGDLTGTSYTTVTDDGPTGEASLKLTPTGTALTSKGYMLAIPYSKDYIPPTAPPATPPTSTPPPPSTPTQKSTYTKKWYATWSRSYEGDNSTRFDDSPYMYQGSYDGSSPGNQKSLAGFDYKNIMATLKGAEIVECHITVKNAHARWNKGLYAEIGSHNYSSKGSTWVDSQVRQRRWTAWVTEGGSVTVNAGATFGKELQAGTSRGIGLGPEATNDHDHYGFFYGATQSGKPYITVKYRK